VFKYLALMLIPLAIFIHTISFARWMGHKHIGVGAASAYLLAGAAIAASAYAFWIVLFA
jgi:hypothetical protein